MGEKVIEEPTQVVQQTKGQERFEHRERRGPEHFEHRERRCSRAQQSRQCATYSQQSEKCPNPAAIEPKYINEILTSSRKKIMKGASSKIECCIPKEFRSKKKELPPKVTVYSH